MQDKVFRFRPHIVLCLVLTLIASCGPGEHRALVVHSVSENVINFDLPVLTSGSPWFIRPTYSDGVGLHEHISVVLTNTGDFAYRGTMPGGSDFTLKPGRSVEIFAGSMEGWITETRSLAKTAMIVSDSGAIEGLLAVYATNATSLKNALTLSAYTAP